MARSLLDEVRALLATAVGDAPDEATGRALAATRDRLDEPLRVAIAGRVKAGKSTLLNALVGQELAPTDAGECTRIVTWYRDGHTYRVLAHQRDGTVVQRPFHREDGAIEVDLGGLGADDVDHLEVWWPSTRLRHHTLIDTPGLASISSEVSARTQRFLGEDASQPATADAVVYLLRHLHSSDVRFLDAFHDAGVGRGSPVNAVGVLSRADEVGSGRLDAMDVAARVAARYQADPQVRRLCSAVVPVAGLLAQAGATLTEAEFRAVATLAAAPASEAADLLLTADRFASSPSAVPVTEAERRLLLGRLGLFGLRLAERLVRTGAAPTAPALAAELRRHSGIEDLRALLLTQLTGRSEALKARSALVGLVAALDAPGWEQAASLRGEVERVLAGAHELVELQRLNQLATGELQPPEALRDEMHRLLGGRGHAPTTRLGLDDGVDEAALRAAAQAAVARWLRAAEHPLYGVALRAAARDVARSSEGILAGLGAGDPS